jgi:hypothetical protein
MSMGNGVMDGSEKLLPAAGFPSAEWLVRNTWSLALGGCLLFWTAVALLIYLV